jgi:phosphodiesterase/alkaline phosphatase D-like protein
MGKIGELDLPIYLDTWDGYPDARERFYALCREVGATDLLVLTGDSHAFWANALFDKQGRSMGLELGTSGISSPGDFERFGPEGSRQMDRLLAEHNPEVIWTDNSHRGYVRIVLTQQTGRADYVAVSDVLSRDFQARLVKRMPLERDDGRLSFG